MHGKEDEEDDPRYLIFYLIDQADMLNVKQIVPIKELAPTTVVPIAQTGAVLHVTGVQTYIKKQTTGPNSRAQIINH